MVNGASADVLLYIAVRSEGKREAGARPARSRHCDKGMNGQCLEIRQSLTFISSVYHTPALAFSNHVVLLTLICFEYHNGYFQRNIQPSSSILLHSLSGDSPSANIESFKLRSHKPNSARSPVKYPRSIFFISTPLFFLSCLYCITWSSLQVKRF